METLMVVLETEAVPIFLWFLVAGVVMVGLGLRFLRNPSITPANKVEILQGLKYHQEVSDA